MSIPAKRKEPKPERRFDKSQLREGTHGKIVHRDYLAHCFRWGWASRMIKPGQRVLDVGCGMDAPLAHVLSGTNFPHGGEYVGVDMNRSIKGHGRTWCVTKPEFDITSRYGELGLFDWVTCFEVIEHMSAGDGLALLVAMREVLKPEVGRIILSTPVFNGKAAKAHIHEWEIPELAMAVNDCGLDVIERWGTFASYPDLKRSITPQDLAVLERVRKFYGDDVTACFLAPLYPDASRNNLWLIRKKI